MTLTASSTSRERVQNEPTHVEVRTIRIHGKETVIDEAIVVSRDPVVIARAIVDGIDHLPDPARFGWTVAGGHGIAIREGVAIFAELRPDERGVVGQALVEVRPAGSSRGF